MLIYGLNLRFKYRSAFYCLQPNSDISTYAFPLSLENVTLDSVVDISRLDDSHIICIDHLETPSPYIHTTLYIYKTLMCVCVYMHILL